MFIKTDYNFDESNIKVRDAYETAFRLGYKAIIISDFRASAFPEIKAYSKEFGIKAIFSIRVLIDGIEYIVIAKNNDGYKDLVRLSSYTMISEEVSMNDFKAYLNNNNLMVVIDGESVHRQDSKSKALSIIADELGKFDIYLGIDNFLNNDSIQKNDLLKELASMVNITTTAMHTAVYRRKKDHKSSRLLKAIREESTLDSVDEEYMKESYMITKEEFTNQYRKEDIDSFSRIVKEANVEVDKLEKLGLPEVSVPEGFSEESYLNFLAQKGLAKRTNNQIPDGWKIRLNKELDIINSMGFARYFLIVLDIVKEAVDRDILMSPGRGSAVGSLVSYSLGITNINPMEHGLMFERFLNVDRISMPDIDLDFQSTRRAEISDYVFEKYGEDYVAKIAAFDRFGPRGSLNSAGKALRVPVDKIEALRKSFKYQDNLYDAYVETYMKQLVDNDTASRTLYIGAFGIEDTFKNMSVHAPGLVISDKPLKEHVALEKNNGEFMVQYDHNFIESEGLIKFDLLPLSTLDIIKDIEDETIPFKSIPKNDAETFELLSSGNTTGIFQLESRGMMDTLRAICPNNLEELALTIALYRPGPMGNIETIARRKDGLEPITYVSQSLEDILKPTYGIIVYQEQIMDILVKMARFTLNEADTARAAMSDKDEDKLKYLKPEFIKRSVSNGYKREEAEAVFSDILKFASYGFNKSHAIAYAEMAYRMAYLKKHHTAHFMAVSINHANKTKKRALFADIKNTDTILGRVNVLESDRSYTAKKGVIIPPLYNLDFMNKDLADKILSIPRDIKSFKEYVARAYDAGLSYRDFVRLIEAGALSGYGPKESLLGSLKKNIELGHASMINGEYLPELVH